MAYLKKISLCIILVLGITFIACHRNAVTGKIGLNLVPENDLMAMSDVEYKKFLAEHPPMFDGDEKVQLVKNCGQRIQKAVEKYYNDKGLKNELASYKWEFNVVDEATINAWCMPGGKVVVYTGLLPVTQDEKGLAVVMGHEIAHAVARHGNQRMSQGMLAQFGGAVLSVALSQKPQAVQNLFLQSFGLASGLGMLKYSRKHESEADKMGLIFAGMAGYDPEAAIAFWERMAAGGGQKPPELLSTHPSDEKRIKDLKAFMPEAKKYYKPQ
ncbi:MAG: M48 family metallopeptidase [Bacteroidota bacterium]|nr:M48 family metallopeptidase [Bacteroidota bacterium]